MTPNSIRWEAPPLSTTSIGAATLYRDGVAALVCGVANADSMLIAAIALDPTFVLARVALAVTRAVGGERYAPPSFAPGVIGRAERQHAEVVRTTLAGDERHASDLRREHLLEFPGDLMIVWLPMARCDRCR